MRWKRRSISLTEENEYLSSFTYFNKIVIMNIFFLSLLPIEIAHMSCDQHVVKIQLEICQMLYTAWHFSNEEHIVHEHAPFTKDGKRRGYRPAHVKHPMTMWIASSLENYLYACKIGIALTMEYTHRYGKIHTCAQHLAWLHENRPSHFKAVSYTHLPSPRDATLSRMPSSA